MMELEDSKQIDSFLRDAPSFLESLTTILKMHVNMLLPGFLDKVKILGSKYSGPIIYLELIDNEKRYIYRSFDKSFGGETRPHIRTDTLPILLEQKEYYVPTPAEIDDSYHYVSKKRHAEIIHNLKNKIVWSRWTFNGFTTYTNYPTNISPLDKNETNVTQKVIDMCKLKFIDEGKRNIINKAKTIVLPYILQLYHVPGIANIVFDYYL